ncbi:bifunctional adenosylcobinamide kinase/adenosylcobinamide-phosphate guanylyltransferase [Bacillus sp. B15-48]|uniref:bifunctional adenosylcobinamide kinase/adenosylcobinamide-phosphate guanylyltransferase n=1 Tax=Bacillus sp. B15-48 TaxID=1548601 RepID=UPI00193FD3C6|nr:bifunctional adenosylcobinamide kinase/adenosylcobinamide-phosphate guanylyltransferase [Bacillus sp. B15-48]MBM4763264.1 hypothetical protein [Bacillus sp. B15-48]
MHFVTGGAFNGKANWVREYYDLSQTSHYWCSAYHGVPLPENLEDENESNVIVLEGVEYWLKDLATQYDRREIRFNWRKYLNGWLEWENEQNQRTLIIIGTDISKGIVPIHTDERKWRDGTGWAYQDTVAYAKRVDLIWYGINNRIK